MTTTQITAVGQAQVCAYRVWPLDADCSIHKVSDVASAIVGTGVVTANMTANLKAGTEIDAETGCGSLAWYLRDIDRIKNWTLALELAVWDYEMLAATIGGQLITGTGATETTWNGKTVGWAAPGPTSNTQPAVAIELWSRAAFKTGACSSSAVAAPTYIRHIFPRCTLQLSDRVFDQGTAAYMKFTGVAEANPKLLTDLKNNTVMTDTPWIGPTTVTPFEDATYIQMFGQGLPVSDNVATFDGGYTVYDFS